MTLILFTLLLRPSLAFIPSPSSHMPSSPTVLIIIHILLPVQSLFLSPANRLFPPPLHLSPTHFPPSRSLPISMPSRTSLLTFSLLLPRYSTRLRPRTRTRCRPTPSDPTCSSSRPTSTRAPTSTSCYTSPTGWLSACKWRLVRTHTKSWSY